MPDVIVCPTFVNRPVRTRMPWWCGDWGLKAPGYPNWAKAVVTEWMQALGPPDSLRARRDALAEPQKAPAIRRFLHNAEYAQFNQLWSVKYFTSLL